jgi:hypothetical protein
MILTFIARRPSGFFDEESRTHAETADAARMLFPVDAAA